MLPPFTVNLERIPLRLVGMQQSSAKAVHGEVGVLSLLIRPAPKTESAAVIYKCNKYPKRNFICELH